MNDARFHHLTITVDEKWKLEQWPTAAPLPNVVRRVRPEATEFEWGPVLVEGNEDLLRI